MEVLKVAHEKPARRLGRGLNALFDARDAEAAASPQAADSAFREISLGEIESNPFQPRKTFDPADLQDLQDSLTASGLLQPVTVRPSPKGTGFQLIAGERRLRAATALGWPAIPAIVKEMTNQEMLTLALVENLQRADLNPIEEAEGYNQLIENFGYTQLDIASMVGKNRSTVANVLRMLQLPSPVRALVQNGKLTAGQARPLLALDSEPRIISFARIAVEKGWSAREVERRVKQADASPTQAKTQTPKGKPARPAGLRDIEQTLRKHFQTDVSVALRAEGRGSITIDFYSPDDLERIVELCGLSNNPQ